MCLYVHIHNTYTPACIHVCLWWQNRASWMKIQEGKSSNRKMEEVGRNLSMWRQHPLWLRAGSPHGNGWPGRSPKDLSHRRLRTWLQQPILSFLEHWKGGIHCRFPIKALSFAVSKRPQVRGRFACRRPRCGTGGWEKAERTQKWEVGGLFSAVRSCKEHVTSCQMEEQ